jgi:glutathione S-transferase
MLEDNKTGWLVGESVTIADLRAHQFVAWMLGGTLDGVPVESMDAYPKLKALYGKVEALPRIAAFRAKYGAKYSSTFDYVPPQEE